MNNKKYRLAGFLLRSIAFALLLSLTLFSTCSLEDDDAQKQNPAGNTPQVTPDPVLPVPNAPIVTASDSILTVRWDAVEGAENYYVYINTIQQPPTVHTKEVAGTTTVLTGLINRTAYYIWIKAVNSSGSSNFSPYARGLPWSANEVPAVPGTPVIIPGIYQLTINWEECGGAVSYEIYINKTADRPSIPKTTTNKTTAVIENLENDVIYYVWVRAVNSVGKSNYSPIESGIPKNPTTAPVSPNRPVLVAGSREITVSWQAVEVTSAYEVWFGTSDNSAQAKKYGSDITGGSIETVITGLENDTTYYVWIKAKNLLGTSGFSPSANAKPSVFNATPLVPNVPSVSLGNEQITVTWTETEGAMTYEVWVSIVNDSANAVKKGEDISASLSSTIDGLANGTTYYFWVKAKNDVGISEFSPVVSGKPIANAVKPTLIAGNGQLSVTWTALTGADQYEVFCGTDVNLPQSATQTVNAPTTSATIGGLVNGTTYNVWVRGKNATGSGVSGVASAKPIGNMGTVTVSLGGSGELVLNWATVDGADQYDVYYSTNYSYEIPASPSQTVTTNTAIISGLTNGTTYYIWVKGKNANGTTNASTMVSGNPMVAPGSLTVSAENEQITISWTEVYGANQYEVYYSTTTTIPDSYSFTVTGLNKTITSLSNGTIYNFWVKAVNTNGISGASPMASGKPIGNIGTVTLTTGESGQLVLNWSTVDGADQYDVYYNTNNSIPTNSSQTVSTNTTAISDLTNGTTYYVWVKGKNENGTSNISATVNGVPMAAPTSLAVSVSAGNEQITVSWAEVAGANQYEVYYSTAITIPNSSVFTVTELNKTITNLINGTTYNFWVKAVNANGTSGASPMASGKPIGNMETVTLTTGGSGELVINWSTVDGADQYEVYYNTNNSIPTNPSQTVSTNTATISGLTNGTTYYVWVKPKNANGTGAVSTAVSGKPMGNVGAVTLTTGGSGELILNWSTVTGADQYEVYYRTSNSIPASPSQTVSTNTATISSLTNGTTYYVWVKGKNTTGTGTASVVVNGKSIGNMGAVTLVSGNEQLTVSWSMVGGADQYDVYYNTSSSIPANPSQTVSTNYVSISGLTNGTMYYVWVKGKNANGTSNTSATVSGVPMATPTSLTVSAGNEQITVSWTAVQGANNYEVYYGTTTTIPDSYAFTVTELNKTITSLSNGTTYNFWVKAVNANGTSGASPMTSGKPIGNMGVVTLTTGESGQLVLNWSMVGGADQYDVYYNTNNSIPTNPSQTVSTNTATIGSLTNGTIYYMWVKGKNANGTGNASNAVNGKPLGTPGAPTVIGDDGQLLVTWTAVLGADEYEVYYGINTPTTLATTATGITATINGLTNGITYYVRLRAKNANGISGYGSSVNGTPGISGLYRGSTKIGNQNLVDSLTYISSNAVSGDNFRIVLGADESASPKTLSYSNKTVGITLLGYGSERTLTLNTNGSMFTVNSGVTLTLDENITLVGRSANNASLVNVNGGNLVTNDGAKITGNTNTNSSSYGSGVRVSDGSFVMNGGEISDNTHSYGGGGVYVLSSNGTFTMSGGKISKNTANGNGGGVYVDTGGTFTMNGGTISGNTANGGGGGISVYNGTFKKLPSSVGQNSGIIYGAEAVGVDTDEIPLKNTSNTGGHAVHSSSQYRNTTAGEIDQIDTTTGKGLSANGNPPFGQ
jgi:hypothetical protein